MSSISARLSATQNEAEMLHNALAVIVQLYTDKSHFIYELLQNAEDAEAHHVKFVQYDDRLELYHDGKPFTYTNLDALRGIGKSDKVKNLNQIGEFGVGFKSVFSICKNVRLYSTPSNYYREEPDAEPEFAVNIEEFFRFKDISIQTLERPYTTKFVFPYAVGLPFSGFDSVQSLKQMVAEKLQDLGITTLLFMRNMRTIEYQINIGGCKKEGCYSLAVKKYSDHCILVSPKSEKTGQSNHADESVSYLKFSRQLDEHSHRTVDIAFAVTRRGENAFKCKSLEQSRVSVYFPTSLDSGLGFIVQGPYRTTPNRESIPMNPENEQDENIIIAKKTASLLRDSLVEMRKCGWLNLSFIRALPLIAQTNRDNKIYEMLYDKVLELFRNPALEMLPGHSGGYVSARFAKLPRSEKMLELFDDDTLTLLVREGNHCCWLPSCITETNEKYKALYSYLINNLDVKLIRPDSLRSYIEKNSDFLPTRTNDWLVGFYELLSSIRGEFDKKRADSNFLTSSIIKISDETFAPAYRRNFNHQLVPNIFSPTGEIKPQGLNFVHEEIYKRCSDFFDSVAQIQTANDLDLYINDIKNRYVSQYTYKEYSHIEDVKNLLRFIQKDRGNQELAEIIERVFLLRCTDGKMRNAKRAKVYLSRIDNLYIVDYFRNIADDVFFVDSDFYNNHEITNEQLCYLGVRSSILVNESLISGEYENGQGARGRKPLWKTTDGFRFKLSIVYLEKALHYINARPDEEDSILKSKTIFSLLLQNRNRLNGTLYIGANNQTKEETCDMHKIVSSFAGNWLCTKDFKWVAPKQISASDLSTEIYGSPIKDAGFYLSLGFKVRETEEVQRLKDNTPSEVLNAYFESEVRRRYKMTASELKERLQNHSSPPRLSASFSFPSVPVKSIQALERHAFEMLYYAAPVKYQNKLQSVRISHNANDILGYLKGMYKFDGHSSFACQMCKQAHVSLYHVQMFNNPAIELIPMYLFLCPNCAQKYKKYRNNAEEISSFRYKIHSLNRNLLTEPNPIRLQIGKDDLYFTQTHIAEIQELFRKAALGKIKL